VTRRIRDLTLAALDDLPATCRSCVFWEVGTGSRGPRPDPRAGGESKEAWWQATQLEWGTPGKAIYVDDVPAGYATFAPREHFPRMRRMGRAVSDDAFLLATLWVAPDHRGQGLATALLQSVLRETHRRGGRALEAYGAPTVAPGATCVVPESFLKSRGFQVLHDDGDLPLLRLDLRQTVRWQESVGHALEGVLSVLSRRERQPAPARARPALETRYARDDGARPSP